MHEELPKYKCPFCDNGVSDYELFCCGRPVERKRDPYSEEIIEDCCDDPDFEPIPCEVCNGEGVISEDEYIYYL